MVARVRHVLRRYELEHINMVDRNMVDRTKLNKGQRILVQWNKTEQYEATIHSWIKTEDRGVVHYDDNTDSKITYRYIVKILFSTSSSTEKNHKLTNSTLNSSSSTSSPPKFLLTLY